MSSILPTVPCQLQACPGLVSTQVQIERALIRASGRAKMIEDAQRLGQSLSKDDTSRSERGYQQKDYTLYEEVERAPKEPRQDEGPARSGSRLSLQSSGFRDSAQL